MRIKDKIISWYIKTVLLPRREIINQSGFICEKMGKGEIYLREFAFPNSIGISLENNIGNKKILYKIGKFFGWNYAKTSKITTINIVRKKDFLKDAHLMVKYMEAISFAEKMNEKIDYEKRVFNLEMENSLIYSYNKKGYIFEMGGIAGIWSYATQNKLVESVILPKGKKCEVIAAPYDYLVQQGYKPIRCTELEAIELTEEYKEFNKIRPTKYAKHSLKDLIDSGFFKYSHGQVTYKGERFFLCEASFMYILEKELKKVKNGLKVLWDVSFDFGKRLAKLSGRQKPGKFIMDFFPALGFGDILVSGKDVFVNYFPWTKWADDVDFTMFRGMLSGVMSGFTGKKVELKNIEKDISQGYLSLHIY